MSTVSCNSRTSLWTERPECAADC